MKSTNLSVNIDLKISSKLRFWCCLPSGFLSVPGPSQWRRLELNTAILPDICAPGSFLQSERPTQRRILPFCQICGLLLLFKMIGESAVVIGSSLYVFCSFFELKLYAGYILFHAVREYRRVPPVEFCCARCRSKYLKFCT